MMKLFGVRDSLVVYEAYYRGFPFYFIFDLDTAITYISADEFANSVGYENLAELIGSDFGLDTILKMKRDMVDIVFNDEIKPI